MPFKFYNEERIAKQVEQLAVLRYKSRIDIASFQAVEDDGEIGLAAPPAKQKSTMHIGDYWKGYDKYLWLSTSLDIPAQWNEATIVGVFDFGETGGGNNSKFESLCFVDGKPYQGVDSNHKEVFLENVAGKTLSLDFRLWSGLVGGGEPYENEHKLKCAYVAVLDEKTDKLFYMSSTVLQTLKILDDANPDKHLLLNTLIKAFNLIDFSEPASDEFYASTKTACDFLLENIDSSRKPDVKVSLIGHTHIDCAWLWRLKHTREKTARSFSTVNRLMNKYDDYIFLQTQAQLYDYLKEDYPEIFQHIQNRVKQGKWEPSGSMWVECDCNLVSGESLVRQVFYGKRFFEREFGYSNNYLWLPDVFGYSWALPQILKQCGVDTFVTTKISWNDQNKLPYDTFYWKGIDGTSILTHFVTTPEAGNYTFYTYNGQVTPYTVDGVWRGYANKDLNTDMLISYGYGDGGGGVTRDMLENIDCISRMPGLPAVRTEHVTEYLDRLNKTVAENPRGGYVPVWDGELYLEFHRGTYTSQAANKKTNRQLELMAHDAELLSAMAYACHNKAYPSEEIYNAWKIILRQQFHDIIPGSSIHEVYEDSKIEYAQAKELLNEAIQGGISSFTAQESDCFSVINTRNWTSTQVVTLPISCKDKSIVDDAGNIIPMVQRENEVDALVSVPAMSSLTVTTSDAERPVVDKWAVADNNSAETPFYRLEWTENGHLKTIFDKTAGRHILKENCLANVIQVFEDKPREYDAWELEGSFENKEETVDQLIDIEVCAVNPISLDIKFAWNYRKSKIWQTMRLFRHTARIDFVTNVDWQNREKLMKVAFPTDIRSTSARFDIQYGSIERSITRNTSWDAAKYETVMHKWVDISESGYGVALLNDSKYGCDVKDGMLRLSLLKSSNFPDYAQDLGMHSFTYSLFPHTEAWNTGVIDREAYEINLPMQVVEGRTAFERMISTDKDFVIIDAVKKAEDSGSVVIRLHEFCGKRGKVKIDTAFSFTSWCVASPLEIQQGDEQTGPVELDIKPFELVTIMIKI